MDIPPVSEGKFNSSPAKPSYAYLFMLKNPSIVASKRSINEDADNLLKTTAAKSEESPDKASSEKAD